MLAQQTRQGALIEANQHMGRLIEEIRNGTLQLRMVPIGETFSRFRRVVRDTAAELGKDVALESSAARPNSTSRWSSASPTR
jgi:two-component system chemotaxis sensor kinase CheA